jgi:hypothetical protein
VTPPPAASPAVPPLQWDDDDGGLMRDIINVASEGWQWPAEKSPPNVEEVFAVEALSPEENRVIEVFKQEVRAAEEF